MITPRIILLFVGIVFLVANAMLKEKFPAWPWGLCLYLAILYP